MEATLAKVKCAVDPPGTWLPNGVYPIPALVTDKLVPVPIKAFAADS